MKISKSERALFKQQYFDEIPLYHSVAEVAQALDRIQAEYHRTPRHIFEDDLMCGLVLMLAEGSPDEAQITEIVKQYYFSKKRYS